MTDRQTDGQTDGRTDRITYNSQDSASIAASRGKNNMLRRNDPVIKSVESALRSEGSLWWERFVTEI